MLDPSLREELSRMPGSLSDNINRAIAMYITTDNAGNLKLPEIAGELEVIVDRLRLLGSL